MHRALQYGNAVRAGGRSRDEPRGARERARGGRTGTGEGAQPRTERRVEEGGRAEAAGRRVTSLEPAVLVWVLHVLWGADAPRGSPEAASLLQRAAPSIPDTYAWGSGVETASTLHTPVPGEPAQEPRRSQSWGLRQHMNTPSSWWTGADRPRVGDTAGWGVSPEARISACPRCAPTTNGAQRLGLEQEVRGQALHLLLTLMFPGTGQTRPQGRVQHRKAQHLPLTAGRAGVQVLLMLSDGSQDLK